MIRKIIQLCILYLSINASFAQAFQNGDLEGVIDISTLPPNWNFVSVNKINSFYPSLGVGLSSHSIDATSDVTGAVPAPNGLASNGIIGTPFSGQSFQSGLRLLTKNENLLGNVSGHYWIEGIEQNITGLTPGQQYTISFRQAVIQQVNAQGLTGAWDVFVDDNLIGSSTPSTSNISYNSLNQIWDLRSVTFTATANSHVVAFLPHDPDLDVLLSVTSLLQGVTYSNSSAGIRMGIDSLNLISTNTTVLNNLEVLLSPDTICAGGCAVLDPMFMNNIGPMSFSWDNGATFSSTAAQTVCPSSTASFTVIGMDSIGNLDTATVVVEVISPPGLDLGNDLTLCDDSLLQLDATTIGCTYLWQDNSINPTFNVTQEGIYHVAVSNSCGSVSDTIRIDYQMTPQVNLGSDTMLCPGSQIVLDVIAQENTDYQWSDNSVNSILIVSQAGTYSVTAMNSCGSSFDQIVVTDFQLPPISLGPDTMVCLGSNINLEVQDDLFQSFQWTEGNSQLSESTNFISISASGQTEYCVSANYLACPNEMTSDCITIFIDSNCLENMEVQDELMCYVPNSFTPDGNEFNQIFKPIFTVGYHPYNYKMLIFNRWGEPIFESLDSEIGWDGTYNGGLVQDGIYSWMIEFKMTNNDGKTHLVGHVNLLK